MTKKYPKTLLEDKLGLNEDSTANFVDFMNRTQAKLPDNITSNPLGQLEATWSHGLLKQLVIRFTTDDSAVAYYKDVNTKKIKVTT